MTSGFMLAAIAAAASGGQETPKSIGPHRNIIEMMAAPPDLLLSGDGSDAQEQCLTIALAFGLGGTPVIFRNAGTTIVASLLPKTFGLVSLMVKIRPDRVIEVRGHDEPQLRMVRACVTDNKPHP